MIRNIDDTGMTTAGRRDEAFACSRSSAQHVLRDGSIPLTLHMIKPFIHDCFIFDPTPILLFKPGPKFQSLLVLRLSQDLPPDKEHMAQHWGVTPLKNGLSGCTSTTTADHSLPPPNPFPAAAACDTVNSPPE